MNRSKIRVGVLGIQGSFRNHALAVRKLGHEPRLVIRHEQVTDLTHLILPGGESTTMHKLLSDYDMIEPIRSRYLAGDLKLFGTCAGAILLGKPPPHDERPPRLELADVVVQRNAYGRQRDSFSEVLPLEGLDRPFPCVFIRAPKLAEPGPALRVLGRQKGEPILVMGERILLTTFHPELTEDTTLHNLFLSDLGIQSSLRQTSVPTTKEHCS